MKAINRDPTHKLTVADLPKEAGMPRTILPEQFKKLSSMAPLNYLTQWRLEKARRILEESAHSVEVIAESVGYQSLAAFNPAFKKHTGKGPVTHRRQHKAPNVQRRRVKNRLSE